MKNQSTSPNPLTSFGLLRRGLAHYWRVNLAVLLAAAVGVAVLTGSLLVGASVRASLRALALGRLGGVGQALLAPRMIGAGLGPELAKTIPGATAPGVATALIVTGSATHAATGERANQVQVLGVEPSFWELGSELGSESDGAPATAPILSAAWRKLGADDTVLNAALARELGARPGDEVLARIERPSALPRESFIGRRDDTVVTLRLTVARILPDAGPAAGGLGDFQLRPTQRPPLNLFIPLATLQRRLGVEAKINTLLTPDTVRDPQPALRAAFSLGDFGLRLREKHNPAFLALESDRVFLPDDDAALARQVAAELEFTVHPTLSYLANSIARGRASATPGADSPPLHAIPYSMVAALNDLPLPPDGIALNDWAARDLAVRPGDPITLTWFRPAPAGGLVETSTTLTLASVVPLAGSWADPGLTPEFPGLTEAAKLADWDPPFPLDLKRIRPVDEQYWNEHRATPKAFVPLALGQQLWGNRFGRLTALRLTGPQTAAFGPALLRRLDPARAGLAFRPVRAQALAASQGASDFGGLFIGFSLFLLASAAMLLRVLFQIGVEARAREYGLLVALGFAPRQAHRLALAEGALLAAGGALAGAPLGLLYAGLMLYGLRTWWAGAVGGAALHLAADPASLIGGALGGWLVALLAIWSALRRLARQSPRDLLAGRLPEDTPTPGRRRWARVATAILTVTALLLLILAPLRPAREQAPLFFAGGAALLAAVLTGFRLWLTGEGRRSAVPLTLGRLGLLAARRRPGRAMLVLSLMASAAFVLTAVGVNRQSGPPDLARMGGAGGFSLLAESTLPIYQPLDPALPPGTRSYAFRLRPGDDASCLNLYQATRPRLLGASEEFIARGGFAFASVTTTTSPTAANVAVRANPWRLLDQPLPGGVIPVIGDANTVVWLLHKGLGQEIELDGVCLRFVALLSGSVFQSELLISAKNFERVFPGESGWRVFAIEAPPAATRALAQKLESAYADYGLDVTGTAERLAGLRAVENTYLATFQSLGGLGLLLGTAGLALALLRNLLERRAEFALLRALGFRTGALLWLAVAENFVPLVAGLLAGAACALLAAFPALLARGATPPWPSLAATLCAVLLFGLLATILSVAAALRAPMLGALKGE